MHQAILGQPLRCLVHLHRRTEALSAQAVEQCIGAERLTGLRQRGKDALLVDGWLRWDLQKVL